MLLLVCVSVDTRVFVARKSQRTRDKAESNSQMIRRIIDKKFSSEKPQRKLSLRLMELPKKRMIKRNERRDMTIESMKTQLNTFTPISLAFIGDYSMNVKKLE